MMEGAYIAALRVAVLLRGRTRSAQFGPSGGVLIEDERLS